MAEFNLHVVLRADANEPATAREYLSEYVDGSDAVAFADETGSDPDVFADETGAGTGGDTEREATLEVDGVDVYAKLYAELTAGEAVAEVQPWGPTAERFPVPVEHYALRQISAPDLYEFYALDDRVTLVVCDSQPLVDQLRRDVPPHALG